MTTALQKIIALLLVICLVSCTTMQAITPTKNSSLTQQVKIGDTVNITKKDGKQLSFDIEKITEKSISGQGIEIKIADIRTIEKKQISAGKTTGLVVGVVASVLAAALLFSVILFRQGAK